jgi:hypothetical protein
MGQRDSIMARTTKPARPTTSTFELKTSKAGLAYVTITTPTWSTSLDASVLAVLTANPGIVAHLTQAPAPAAPAPVPTPKVEAPAPTPPAPAPVPTPPAPKPRKVSLPSERSRAANLALIAKHKPKSHGLAPTWGDEAVARLADKVRANLATVAPVTPPMPPAAPVTPPAKPVSKAPVQRVENHPVPALVDMAVGMNGDEYEIYRDSAGALSVRLVGTARKAG